jgi:hypothetical protein
MACLIQTPTHNLPTKSKIVQATQAMLETYWQVVVHKGKGDIQPH